MAKHLSQDRAQAPTNNKSIAVDIPHHTQRNRIPIAITSSAFRVDIALSIKHPWQSHQARAPQGSCKNRKQKKNFQRTKCANPYSPVIALAPTLRSAFHAPYIGRHEISRDLRRQHLVTMSPSLRRSLAILSSQTAPGKIR